MAEYNLDWLKEKGFFEKTVPLALAGKDVLVDEKNSLAYAEVKNNEEIEEIKRGLSSHKVRYIWFYFPSESKLKTFRKIGEVKWFYYSPRMRGEYLKSRIDKLNKFSPGDMNSLFDIRDVVNRFYWQLWEARIKMARSVKKIEEEKNKLLAVQHLIDRLIFFYFLAQLGLVSISSGNEKRIWKLDRTHTRQFFDWICGFLDDEKLQEFLNRVFFDVLGKSGGGGWSGLEFNIGGERFSVVAPSLNGGLFREEKIENIEESEIKIEGTRELIWGILNKYNWIIGEESPEEEDVIGDLTPEIIGHIYEKFVVSLEQIGLEKVDFDDIQTVKGELKLGRKKIGAYYTPEEITNYISKNTIYPCITDKINERFKRRYRNIWKELLNKKRLTEEEGKIVKFLYFDVLTQLRICDNACGSGSFLIAAGEVLLRLYSKVIKLLRNYQSEDKKIKEILEGIERSPSRNYYIVRQIITNNLYGVDLMGGAVEIAKLRLWLWLISQMEPKDIEGRRIETLPNLDYNLMAGNSLIGFVDIRDIAKTLSSWLGESKEEWLKNLAKEKQKFKTLSARDAERLKEKLEGEIRKTRGFLNRRFFELVKAKGVEMPYDDYEEFAEDLKPFHWGFEFYDAFDLDKPKGERGFDVVIGNPPYIEVKKIEAYTKPILRNIYHINNREILKGRYDIFWAFYANAIQLLREKGYLAYISSDSFLDALGADNLRQFIVTSGTLLRLNYVGNPFQGPQVSTIILEYKKEKRTDYRFILRNWITKSIASLKKSEVLKTDHDIININIVKNRVVEEILREIEKDSVELGDIIYLQQGMILQSKKHKKEYFIHNAKKDQFVPYIEGKDIDRYFLPTKHRWLDYQPLEHHRTRIKEVFTSKKLLVRRIADGVKACIGYGNFFTDNTIYTGTLYCDLDPLKQKYHRQLRYGNELSNKSKLFSYEFLLGIINSKLITFYFYSNYKTFSLSVLNKLKIRPPSDNYKCSIGILSSYLQFLNSHFDSISILDKTVDSLVYELYFKEKFEEEGLKTNLLGLVEHYLEDIEGLEGTDEEKLRVVKQVVEGIENDKAIKEQIERIKSHEWVKVIEGEK